MNLINLNKIKYNVIESDNFYHATSHINNYEYSFDIFCLVSLSLFFFKWFSDVWWKVKLKEIKWLIYLNIWWILVLLLCLFVWKSVLLTEERKEKDVLFHSLMKNNFKNYTLKA
jgi:hypothetical protein